MSSTGATEVAVRTFAREPTSVGLARRFASSQLRGEPVDLVEAAVLAVSELATNAVRHAASDFDLTVSHGPVEVRIAVTDRGAGQPRMRDADLAGLGGRGLRIVQQVADRWGWSQAGDAKTVWLTLARGQ